MFDEDGNVLVTNCSSADQSVLNSNPLNSRLFGSQVGGKPGRNGPHAHISPMRNFRKVEFEENSIRQISSSQNPPAMKRGAMQE